MIFFHTIRHIFFLQQYRGINYPGSLEKLTKIRRDEYNEKEIKAMESLLNQDSRFYI